MNVKVFQSKTSCVRHQNRKQNVEICELLNPHKSNLQLNCYGQKIEFLGTNFENLLQYFKLCETNLIEISF